MIPDLLSANTELLWAAVVSAVVSAAVSYYFKRRETRHKLAVEYEYEQRKKLRDLIGRYHGRVLFASNSLNYRFWNLYSNSKEAWLQVDGEYQAAGYYFLSTLQRFMGVCSLITQFESEAIYVDARIADKRDFIFLNYLAALRWVLTDVALFDGLSYDSFHQTDHFFSDNFRRYSQLCLSDRGSISYDELRELIARDRGLDPVLRFFDGLQPAEDRLRWDRLVAFHLLLMAFINSFGYSTQRSNMDDFREAARQARHLRVLENLLVWIPQHGLAKDKETRRIVKVVKKMTARVRANESLTK